MAAHAPGTGTERGASMPPTWERSIAVPAAVQGKAFALGAPGRRWLKDLPERLRSLERDWDLTAGAPLSGGSASYVTTVTTADGTPAVLKLQLPGYDDVAGEIRVLQLAAGCGYARLLRADAARGALLLERLGRPLNQLGLPTSRQLAIICATLKRAWVRSPESARLLTGADKAIWLRAFITERWHALDRPCEAAVIERALAFGESREAAFDPAQAVLVHGDPHNANTLAPLGGAATATDGAGFKFIDPDGLFAERAYDLAILMRGWSAELLAGDALRLGQERCAALSRLTGEDSTAIWQWGFVERVSTGLLLLQTGGEREGRDCLRVAKAWMQF
jgi:streptomycin 6-kinase